MNEIIKVCKTHGDLTIEQTWSYIHKIRKKEYIRCLQCKTIQDKKYFDKKRANPEYLKKKRIYENNRWATHKAETTKKRKRPEALQKRREWYAKNRERYLPYYKKLQNKYINDLSDTYVKRRINDGGNLKHSEIPQHLVELKREIIILRRLIKLAKIEEY